MAERAKINKEAAVMNTVDSIIQPVSLQISDDTCIVVIRGTAGQVTCEDVIRLFNMLDTFAAGEKSPVARIEIAPYVPDSVALYVITAAADRDIPVIINENSCQVA